MSKLDHPLSRSSGQSKPARPASVPAVWQDPSRERTDSFGTRTVGRAMKVMGLGKKQGAARLDIDELERVSAIIPRLFLSRFPRNCYTDRKTQRIYLICILGYEFRLGMSIRSFNWEWSEKIKDFHLKEIKLMYLSAREYTLFERLLLSKLIFNGGHANIQISVQLGIKIKRHKSYQAKHATAFIVQKQVYISIS